MRVSQTSTSTKKTNPHQTSRSRSKSLSNSQVENKYYFCHYKNSMYMGGMKSFHRNGEGIIIHDNGSSIVCSYYNDFKHGHNISYSENCIMSMVYQKNKLQECAIRLENYLIYLRYNKQAQLEGKGVLIDYQKRNLTYLVYKKNILINKRQEKQYAIINRVFDLENLQFLIGIIHSKVLRFEMENSENIACIKSGSKVSIGFAKRGLLNGLGFTFNIKEGATNPDSNNNHNALYLKLVERGYFQNSHLSGMGEKWFKNGNYYIGDFKDSIFEGRGILKNSEKNNWVLGCFCKGNMSQLIQYSNESDPTKFSKLVEVMHERKSSWINKQIAPENPDFFIKEIDKIINNKPLVQMKTLQERKQEVLRKIQDNFLCDKAQGSVFQQLPVYEKSGTKSNNQEEQSSSDHRNFGSPFRSPQEIGRNQSENSAERPQQETVPRSIYNIKLLQVPNTGTPVRSRQASASPIRFENSQNKLKMSQKSMGLSQIKDESPSFKLDSKRLIGRSRLFKYTQKDEAEEPPQFNFTLKSAKK